MRRRHGIAAGALELLAHLLHLQQLGDVRALPAPACAAGVSRADEARHAPQASAEQTRRRSSRGWSRKVSRLDVREPRVDAALEVVDLPEDGFELLGLVHHHLPVLHRRAVGRLLCRGAVRTCLCHGAVR